MMTGSMNAVENVAVLLILVWAVLLCGCSWITTHKVRTESPPYRTFVLNAEGAVARHRRFFAHYHGRPPRSRRMLPSPTVVVGPDTRTPRGADPYRHQVDPSRYAMALRLYLEPHTPRPDTTYFNLGAIGCFVGHMRILRQAVRQGVQYALVFEDNVLVQNAGRLDATVRRIIHHRGSTLDVCFFHCLAFLPWRGMQAPDSDGLWRVAWIESTKCYLVNVPNFEPYLSHFDTMDAHLDHKFEDAIANGARVYYKPGMRSCLRIDPTQHSLISHTDYLNREFFSHRYPHLGVSDLRH